MGKSRMLKAGVLILAGVSVICAVLGLMPGLAGGGEEGEPSGEHPEEKGTPSLSAEFIASQALSSFLPVFSFPDAVEDEEGRGAGETGEKEQARLLYELLLRKIPLLAYEEGQKGEELSLEDEETYDMLIRAEGSDEDRKGIDEDDLDYSDSALHISDELEKAMREENSLHNSKTDEDQAEGEKPEASEEPEEGEKSGEFLPAEEKAYEYDWSQIGSYESLVSNFYAVDNTTSITDSRLNMENLMERDMTMKTSPDNPQILIYHTHSQEAFVDSTPGDPSSGIVGAGEYLAELLRGYGFNVIHHTGEYDVESRDYAYSNALPAIERILAENPTIEVVVDLHRDAVKEGRKLAVDLQDRPTAQFMFFNGLSRTRKNGDIDYLPNPYVNDNLAFSFQMQVACNEYYPGLTRRIYLKAYRYNMHLRAKTLLIEMGAQTNTVEEIHNACDPLAHILSMVLNGQAP